MISLVVPVWNEERLLPAFLEAILPRLNGGGGELIVVDGFSNDRTFDAAGRYPEARWLCCKRGRGRQMNHGARDARGSLLVFLPVDTRPDPGFFRRLRRIDAAAHPRAGGFRQRFDNPRKFLRLISGMHNLRARLTGVHYGDQAPFVRRDLFVELGGFSEDVDMEDVEFGTRLRREVRPEYQPLTVTTSARRFDEAGDLRATAEAARLLAGWVFLRRIGRSRVFFDKVR